jgi:cytochrome c553
MKNSRVLVFIPVLAIILCGFILVALAQSPHQPPPYWAFAIDPNSGSSTPTKEDTTPKRVPGSHASYTLAEIDDMFRVPDWHPEEHPAMPDIVAHGRKPDVYACGYCHLPNGLGRPENASIAGLAAGYIARQLDDFKTGVRKSSEPRHLPAAVMAKIGSRASDAEVKAAAQYFSQLKRKPWIRVVETATVPKTHVAGWMLVASTPVGTEPIGERVIEMPENLERTELRDDTSGFVAYVPVGSLQRGKMLVTTGDGGKTTACAKCHGPGLRGAGNIPSIAGRSPSYVVRQMFDIQSGARAGVLSRTMKPMVEKLSMDDMVAIAAYLASLRP